MINSPRRFDKKNNIIFATIVLAATIFVLSYFFVISYVTAGEIGLAVTRNRFDIEMLSGDTYKGDLAVYVELALWNIKEDSEDIEFVEAEPLLNATRWFEIQPRDFILDKDGGRQ